MGEALFFWGFAGVAVLLGALVIIYKNPVHSALALIGNLFCVAALFAMLDAHFLAAIQVLVYAGAILVLFLFVIMLLNLQPDELGQSRRTAVKAAGVFLVAWLGLKLVFEFGSMRATGFADVPETYGTLETIGTLLFTTYLLPFEVASILLLAAMLGSVSIAKRRVW